MGNEMGNINTTGIQEEEIAAVEDQKNSLQQAAHAEDVNRENQMDPAAEGKEFQEKLRKLPSHDPTEAQDPLVDDLTFNGKEQADTELKPPQSPELPTHSSDELSQDGGIQKTSSIDVDGNEKPMKSDLNENLQETSDYQILEQYLIRKEKEEESNATVDPKSAALDPRLLDSVYSNSDQCELSEVHAEPQLEEQSQSPEDQKAVIGMSMKCDEKQSHSSETEATSGPAATVCSDTGTEEDVEKKNADSQVKEMVFQEEKSSDTGICEEKQEIVSRDDVGTDLSKITTSTFPFNHHNESENKCNGAELPAELVLSRNGSSKSQAEAISSADSFDPSEEVLPEPYDKCIVLDEGTELIGNGSDDETKYDPSPTQVYEQAMKGLKPEEEDLSELDSITIVSDCDKGLEIVADSIRKTEIDCQIKEGEAAENGCQLSACYDKQLPKDLEELTQVATEIGKLQAGLTIIGYGHDEEAPAEKETCYEMENARQDSNKFRSVREVSEATEQQVSQADPADHTTGFVLPSPGSALQSQDHKPDTAAESETADSNSLLITEFKQGSSEYSVTQASVVDCTKSTEQTLVSAVGQEEDEPGQDLPRHNNATVAATEALANQSIDLHEKGEKFTLASFGCEAQESMGRISIESNPDNSSIRIEFRKSPSFGFDLPLDARPEESDQTPLLRPDKAATRRFPSQDSINFGNSRIKAEYGRDLLQYQAMPVKEKTIKTEKSNSEASRAPFPSFSKADEQAPAVSSEKQDSHDSNKKEVREPWSSTAKEVRIITPSKGRGKRKPKPSLFSTCICCAAAIH